MAMLFSVRVDFSAQLQALDPTATLMPRVANAVEQVAIAGQSRWQEAVHAVPGLWIGERQAYAASIKLRQLGPYSWEISSDYKYVEDIESGRPPYDLKKMLDTSLKVRVSKKGVRYLIIPFRHNTPGNTAHAPAMHPEVYESARELAPSKVSGHGKRVSGTGAFDINTKKPLQVRRRKYVWGGRLAAEPTFKLKPEHKSDPYAGMVRFKESTGGSTYMTFRVMTQNSSGWIIPARPGLWIARTVSESLQRTLDKDVGAAVAQDLAGG